MKHAIMFVVVNGCSADGNPPKLWLSPQDSAEATVKLIDHEPPPF